VWYYGEHDAPFDLFSEVYIARFYEPLANAPKNAIVLDIGAITMFWAAGRPDILFHAYEPNPQSSATLRKNVEANQLSSQVRIFPEALSGSRDPIELLIDVPTHPSSSYGNAPTGDGRTIADIGRKIQVPAITLNDAWERTGRTRIWMLKIDVEGAEADILEAASNEMLANVENACIELSWTPDLGPSAKV
jgi:FkbM family methyltransferase